MSKQLRASIVIDYHNVHLVGRGLFLSTRVLPKHQTLIDPLMLLNGSSWPGTRRSSGAPVALSLRRLSGLDAVVGALLWTRTANCRRTPGDRAGRQDRARHARND